MSHIENELYSQPECWERAAELALTRGALLPEPGERVAVVGCGTSLFMAQAAAALREDAGHGETHAHAASEFPAGRHYDRVVALTRSGATTEVLRLLAGLRGRVRTTVITTDAATPVASAADDVLALDFADEKSVVQTRFPTSALTLLRTHFGLHSQEVVDDAHDALAEPLPPWLVDCTQFTFLGRGWTVGLAGEAAHKMRESQLPDRRPSGPGVPAWPDQCLDPRHGHVDARRGARRSRRRGARHRRHVGGRRPRPAGRTGTDAAPGGGGRGGRRP